MSNILKNRKWQIDGGWYSPIEKLRSFKSVTHAEYLEMCSSAGDWSGIFFQKIRRLTYIIGFNQSNNYPRRGFTLFTGDVFGVMRGKISKDDINDAIHQFIDAYY